jgi:beta-mannosidase
VRPDAGAAAELAALTRPVVEAVGLDALWVDSTPTGGEPVTRVDTGVAQYFGVGAYLRPLADARTAGVLFAAETLAFSHLPEEGRTDAGVPRDNGSSWDFADVRRHYLAERHGPDAGVEQEQRVTGEVMAEVFGEWRRPASPCAGGVVLWLRDLAPGAGWGLLDHEGRPKPAARALAPALAPTALWLVDEGLNGLDVHVAHDPPDPVEVVLRVALLRADGSEIEAAEEAWTMPGHGHRVLGVEALLGRFADVSRAYRFGPPAHAAVQARLRGAGPERVATWWVPEPAPEGPEPPAARP